MPFKRRGLSEAASAPGDLTARLIGIGFGFEGEGLMGADIEEALVEASRVGMDGDDLRVLSVLTTWFGVHHGHVNADRLVRCVAAIDPSDRVRAYWSAVASWTGDRRFARFPRRVGPVDLLRVGSDFQISRRGQDPRFVEAILRVPLGTLRDRATDVLTPTSLARLHPGYRNRILMGPSWRADVWTAFEHDPSLTPAQAARLVGCGFATAWQVARDFSLFRQLEDSPPPLLARPGIDPATRDEIEWAATGSLTATRAFPGPGRTPL